MVDAMQRAMKEIANLENMVKRCDPETPYSVFRSMRLIDIYVESKKLNLHDYDKDIDKIAGFAYNFATKCKCKKK